MNSLVDNNIAQLLKQKGFDEPCNNYTDKRDGDYFSSERQVISYRNYNELGNGWSRPTVADVLMWLYRKHNLWIEARLEMSSKGYRFSPYIECSELHKSIRYPNPTEAYLPAIKYALENLIE